MRYSPVVSFILLVVLLLGQNPVAAQSTGAAQAHPIMENSSRLDSTSVWTAVVGNEYRVEPNITYFTAGNWESKLDLYLPLHAPGPTPTVIYFHGGGWNNRNREYGPLMILPYLQLGFAAVNVGYRTSPIASAPAAVEDCRCALRWIVRHAKEYNLDTSRVVVTGHSAGGHLALMMAMLPLSAGFDRPCAADEARELGGSGTWRGFRDVRVTAVINWFGIADVVDLLDGPNMKSYAVTWLGSRSDRNDLARRLSPLTYVRAGQPPVLTIHGDADPISPFEDAVRFHAALTRAGVPNQLMTIPGGGHGGFTREQTLEAYRRVWAFLAQSGLLPPRSAAGEPRHR
jgi:acetyl esterase/lipase